MYTRGTPPSNLSLTGLVEWLLLELGKLETELSKAEQRIKQLEETQNAP